MKKKARIICAAVVMLMSIFVLSSCTLAFPSSESGEPAANISSELPSEASPSPSVEPTIQITATDLLAAYEENQVNADNQYKGKLLEVTGIIDDIGTDIMDDVYVTINNGDEYAFTCVQCFFKNKDEIAKVSNLKPGSEITIVGKCDGEVFNVLLKDCKIK